MGVLGENKKREPCRAEESVPAETRGKKGGKGQCDNMIRREVNPAPAQSHQPLARPSDTTNTRAQHLVTGILHVRRSSSHALGRRSAADTSKLGVDSSAASIGLLLSEGEETEGGETNSNGDTDTNGGLLGKSETTGSDAEGSLLRAVGEVVVTGRSVLVGSITMVNVHETILRKCGETSRSLVELGTVIVGVLFVGLSVVVGTTAGLLEESETLGDGVGTEEVDRGTVAGHVGTRLVELDHVHAVRVLPSLTVVGVLGGVEVGTMELDVDNIVSVDIELAGDKVILDGGVRLHDVSTTSTGVEVVDGLARGPRRTSTHSEHVRAILEGTGSLVGVEGDGDGRLAASKESDVGTVEERLDILGQDTDTVEVLTLEISGIGITRAVAVLEVAVLTVVSRGEHRSTGGTARRSVGHRGVVHGGDVVTNTDDAELSSGLRGDLPVVVGGLGLVLLRHDTSVAVDRGGVSEMVITAKVVDTASGLATSVGGGAPGSGVVSGLTGLLGDGDVVVLLAVAAGIITLTVSGLDDVLGTVGEVVTVRRGRGQDGDITPRSRAPVRVVVTLLGTLETTTGSVVVLTGVLGRVSVEVLVGGIQTLVTLGGLTEVIPLNALVVSVLNTSILTLVVEGSALGGIVGVLVLGDGVGSVLVLSGLTRETTLEISSVVVIGSHNLSGGVSIAETGEGILTGVLDDDLTVKVVVGAAGMLVGPLDAENGTRVVLERIGSSVHGGITTPGVSSLSVVLGIEQTVSVVTVIASLTVTTVGTGRVVHVHIGARKPDEERCDEQNAERTHVVGLCS